MKHTKTLFFILILSIISLNLNAQINLVKDGKAQSRIIVNKSNAIDLQAANLFQDFVKRITGAQMPILPNDAKMQKGDILVGDFQLPVKGIEKSKITEDGFQILTTDGYIRIVGNEGSGTIYGMVTLLENYFGVRYFSKDAIVYPANKTLTLASNISLLENPSFRFRQTQSYSLRDSIYKLWHRLETPREVFASNLWVHTFDRLLPSSQYGAAHPEYYSLINGERRPGAASQWCLTNPEVFEIVSKRIDSIFKANPDKKIISVSQNDGNATYCTCPKCKEIDDREGSPSGTLIYFMNKLAERFPDKEFSTLAYLYSVKPPKYIKPLQNVNIMLCDIDCHREVTLNENPSGRDFVKDMEGWSKISNNIFVWDYGINFDNYISPFPNFHILQPNMELFHKNNATMHFSQISSIKGGDFSELRSYIVTKLLWNTSVNVDSIIHSFLNGYYGEGAAPYIYDYIKLREGALMGSNISLWIYDTPITHKNGMLNKPLMKRYKELFDKAEEASKNNKVYLDRVREARLPIQYAELEIARTEPIEDVEILKKRLFLFRDRAKEFDVIHLNERNNKISEYVDLYLERNLPRNKNSLAQGAKIEFLKPANKPYDKIADVALTDGLFGGATFNESWVGWVGKDAEFIIDLGEEKEFSSVEADFLHKLGSWIMLPKSVSCSISLNNKDFAIMGKYDVAEDKDPAVKFVTIPIKSEKIIKARYIKMSIETIGLCPPWHYGVGHPAWFFVDEIMVY